MSLGRGRGIAFAGRLSEEFKLASGTWVRATTLRTQLIDALQPFVRDRRLRPRSVRDRRVRQPFVRDLRVRPRSVLLSRGQAACRFMSLLRYRSPSSSLRW